MMVLRLTLRLSKLLITRVKVNRSLKAALRSGFFFALASKLTTFFFFSSEATRTSSLQSHTPNLLILLILSGYQPSILVKD